MISVLAGGLARSYDRRVRALPCAFLLLAACGGSPAGPPAQSTLSGTITADTDVTGVVSLTGGLTIGSGATVTVEAGTIIEAAGGASIDVQGTLLVMGAKGNEVTIESATTGDYWGGVRVEGTYEMHYGTQTGGPINTTGGTTTIIDSVISDVQGDYLTEDGGTVDVEYTNLGDPGGTNTHCNIHINSVSKFTFTHSSNAGSVFGLMLYGGSGLDFTHSNWLANNTDIEPGATGMGSFDGDYFQAGEPAGVQGSTFDSLSATPLTDVGPR